MNQKSRKKMGAIIRYPGSKWSLAQWIISLFPEHHSYLEPFFGSGAVLFNKPRSHIETINDLDGNVINLFEWIKRDPEQLAYNLYCTPYARQVYDDAFNRFPENGLEKAVNFYIRMNMGHGTRTTGEKSGWKNDVQGRERAYAAKDWCRLPEKIFQAAERLQGVQIESMPAVQLIKRFNYPKVLIYADPPYILGTRHGKQYRCEMKEEDHEELLAVLLEHKGPVLISGYDSDLYQDRLQGWHQESKRSRTHSGVMKEEIVWMNFELEGQMRMRLEK